MTEGLALEKSGIETNLLMSMPPWYMKNGKFEELPLSTLPGTKRNEGVDWPREYVVEKAKLWPSLLVACDGATTFNLTGVSVGSEKPDMFSDTTKEEMGATVQDRAAGEGANAHRPGGEAHSGVHDAGGQGQVVLRVARLGEPPLRQQRAAGHDARAPQGEGQGVVGRQDRKNRGEQAQR